MSLKNNPVKERKTMTTIALMTTDQYLTVSDQPKIASGDQNSVSLHVDFDSEWNGYGKSAVFFSSKNETVYEQVLTDSECIIPHEVLAEPCTLYIGIRGVTDDNYKVKTSTLVKYKIEEGAPVGEGTTVEPSATVYQQLLALSEDTRQIAQAVRDDFNAGAIPALLDQNSQNGFRFWTGTAAEYEVQKADLPANTFCVIIDDTTEADLLAEIANKVTKLVLYDGEETNSGTINQPFEYVSNFDVFIIYGAGVSTTIKYLSHAVSYDSALVTAYFHDSVGGSYTLSLNKAGTASGFSFTKSGEAVSLSKIIGLAV